MTTVAGPGPLGEFLTARRARLRPSPSERGVGTRRVPGLRREELATRAGISAVYYARLEQGTSRNASPEVLEALSRALRLADGERRHLLDVAALSRGPAPAGHEDEELAEPLAQLLPALRGVPALVLGRALDVLAWNAAGHALTAGHLDANAADDPARRPNSAVNVFLDPAVRALYPDWVRKTRAVVGHLRMITGSHPGDARLAQVVSRLLSESPEFATLWDDHTVGRCDGRAYELDHPHLGRLRLDQQTLSPVGARDQSLVTFTAADDATAAALARLTALV